MEHCSIVLLERCSIDVNDFMVKTTTDVSRRKDALSRERIIEASIVLLDRGGESGLTFRALAEYLATGPGAIYWHVDNKRDLLTAACDDIISRAMAPARVNDRPEAALRVIALGLYDALDVHPWVGAALTHTPGALPSVRILERLGQQVLALGVPVETAWPIVSTLLHYILGVGGQNAANTQIALEQKLDRDRFLTEMSTQWRALGVDDFPFTRSIAAQMAAHDDREDFLTGLDLILRGIGATRRHSTN